MTQSYLDSLGADDYCAALYRLTAEQGRKVTPEDLSSELDADPAEAARCLKIFQEHDLMALHEGFLTLTSSGRANAEFTLAKHARIAEFLAGVLKLSPLEACRNAARIRNVIQRDALAELYDYVEEHDLEHKLPEEELIFLFPSLTSCLEKRYGYLFDPLYLTIDNYGSATMARVAEYCAMKLPTVREEVRLMAERGFLEKVTSDDAELVLTPLGKETLNEIVSRHVQISEFLKFTLEVEEEEAQENAWQWKFLLSEEAMKAIRAFLAENGIAAEL
ncbi:iron dependent repressor, metal binding and dimerization domain protein [Succinimonas sp.]|uniref:iron dependent repressor, metal binding and dimerization domain protein n=1 Tax=Succinimonas sp. TaxID=1936151 RepID=UPI00386F0A3A